MTTMMMMLNAAVLSRAVASRAESIIRGLLEQSGIAIGGGEPHDITVHDDRFYLRTLRDGSLGFGESYMEGWWDAPALDQTIAHILASRTDEKLPVWADSLLALRARVQNLQSRARAPEVGKRHYDVGNDLYRAIHRLREAGASLRRRAPGGVSIPLPSAARRAVQWAVARGFVWMFTGAPLPPWMRPAPRGIR